MPTPSAELKVTAQPNCPADAGNLCGFTDGMDVIIFDTSGNFDLFTITHVQDSAAHLQHRGQTLSTAYDVGASVTQITSNTYYLNRQTHQLMRYNLYDQDTPLVDDVVDLKFEYFGDPNPPTAPKPRAGVENCLYDAAGNYKNLPVLAADELRQLSDQELIRRAAREIVIALIMCSRLLIERAAELISSKPKEGSVLMFAIGHCFNAVVKSLVHGGQTSFFGKGTGNFFAKSNRA